MSLRCAAASLALLLSATSMTEARPIQEAQSPRTVAEAGDARRAGELVEDGVWLLEAKRYDEAISSFTEALRFAPRDGLAFANRALAYAFTNRLEDASRDLAAAEAVIPGRAITHRVRALIALRRSDNETALAELTQALAKEPGNEFALNHRAYLYQRIGDEHAALADAEAFIAAHSDRPDGYVLKADLLIMQQKEELAIAEADRLAMLFPDDAYSLAAAARIYDGLRRRDQALEAVSKAISIEPDLFYYRLLRAKFRRWDDFEGRRADLHRALQLDPGNADILTELGLIDFKQRRWADAVARFSAVLEREPKDFGLLAYRAMAHGEAGEASLASRDFDAASAAASGADDFSLVCGVFAREGIALDWALQACNQAIALKENESVYHANRGLVALRLGRLDQAMADYNIAVEADSRRPHGYYGRALTHWRQGKKRAAQDDRNRALALDPAIEEQYREYGFTDF